MRPARDGSAHGPKLSARTGHLRRASVLRTLTERVATYPDGINLGQGVCDLDLPPVLADAAVRSIRESRATYTPYAGVEPLRREIAARMERRYGVSYAPEQIVVTVGASAAISATFLTLLDPGDHVVLFEPYYPYHRSAALLAGAQVTTVSLDDDGEPDWDALSAALAASARLVVVNTPANPSGHVWSAARLSRLGDALATSDARVMTDELYEDLVYDGATHVPPASIPALAERTVTVSGLGKAYSITGWRLGWLAAPRALADAIGPVFDTLCVCAPRPLQEGAAEALRRLPESYYRDLRDGYERRRDRLAAALAAGGFRPRRPAGAYYMLADYRDRFGPVSTAEASFRLLEEARIAAIPGEVFHDGESPPVLRFHFAVEEPVLDEVARRLGSTR